MTHPTPKTLLALALVLAGVVPQDRQTGLRPEPPARDPDAIQRTMEERLVGAWQLIGVTYDNVPQVKSSIAGYMLVLPDYLSIEMHLLMRSALFQDDQRPFFQSGVHRWRIVNSTMLETSSLIGNGNVNDFESWTFEQPGVKRTFQMVLNEGSLVLERRGESRMTFRKLPRLPFPGRDLEFRKRMRQEEAAERAREEAEREAGSKPADDEGGE